MPLQPGHTSGPIGRRTALSIAAAAGAGLSPVNALAQRLPIIRGRDGWLFAPWDDVQRVDLTNLPRVCQITSQAAQLIRATGVEVTIALVPAKAMLYHDMLPQGMVVSREARQRYGAARAALTEGGAGLVPDLSLVMQHQRAARPDQRLFFKADTHWTAAGAEVGAAAMSAGIQATMRLPPSTAPGERLGPPVRRTRGRNDLLDFIPAAERRSFPAEEYLIRAPVARGAASLLQDDRADVAAVGSSFLHPDFNFAPTLSATLARPVALEWKPQNVGPYQTMLDYLRSQLFRQQRPRLLVWCLLEGAMVILPTNRSAFPEHAMTANAFLDGVRSALAAA